MGNPKDIFKSHSILTEKEISDYLNGNLSEEQKIKIERKISQDEFNADALEGLESNPAALVGYESARETILKKIDKKSGGWQFHHTIILSVILVIVTTVLGSKLFPESGNLAIVGETEELDSSFTTPIVQTEINVAELTDIEIEDAIELPEIHLVKAKEVIITSPVVLDTLSNETKSNNMTFDETVQLIKVDPIAAPEKIEVPTIDKVVYSNVPLFYAHKFLLVDYSRILNDEPVIQQNEFSGTSAALENKEDQLTEGQLPPEIVTIKIPYKDYINETQELFGKNNFKAALKRYKVILKSYPEDLNAHFYSGLCYFNIGKYNLAHQHFTFAEKHAYNAFKIDAEWYNAKTFYMEGKNESCKKVLSKIIEENDYYTEQAKQLLKKLN
jgi:hypothetical protein